MSLPKTYALNEPSTYALSFDGTNEFVYIPPSNEIANNGNGWTEFTLQCWIKIVTSSRDEYIIAKDASGVNTGDFSLQGSNQSAGALMYNSSVQELDAYAIMFQEQAPPSTFRYLGVGNLQIGTWYYVTVVNSQNGNYRKLYLNGVLKDSSTAYGAIWGNSTTPLNFASTDNATSGYWLFAGMLDEIRIYSVARTEQEIINDYNSGLGIYEADLTGLIAWYKFDEGSGINLYDRSGKNNHGTLKNSPTWVSGLCPDWYPINVFYIQPNHIANLVSVSYANNILGVSIFANTGTSNTKIYCATKGEPRNVEGASSWSYNIYNKILSLDVLHSSSKTVLVDWIVETGTSPEYTTQVEVSSIPLYLSEKLGIPLFAGQLLCSGFLVFVPLLSFALISRRRSNSWIAELAISLIFMSVSIALQWLPVWLLFVFCFILALMFAGNMRDWLTGRGS